MNYKYKFKCGCVLERNKVLKISYGPLRGIRCPDPDHDKAPLIAKVWLCKWCGQEFETGKETGRANTCSKKNCILKRNAEYHRNRRRNMRTGLASSSRRDEVNQTDNLDKPESKSFDIGDFMPPVPEIPDIRESEAYRLRQKIEI